jgi:hypothetical protein
MYISEGVKAQRIVGVQLCKNISAEMALVRLWGVTSRHPRNFGLEVKN